MSDDRLATPRDRGGRPAADGEGSLAPRPITLLAYSIPLWLLGAAVALVVGYVITQKVMPLYLHGHGATDRLVRFFDLDVEGNLPSWFSATLWSFAALLAFGASAQSQATRQARSRWTWLGVLYVVLSMDEMSSWHEMIGIVLRRASVLVSVFHYPWIAYGIVFTAVVGAYFAPFVLRLPRYVLGCIVVAAAVYLSCAVGLEWYGGKVADGALSYPFGLTAFHEVIVEESGEMLGVIILIHGLLVYLAGNEPGGRFGFEVRSDRPGQQEP